MEDVHLEEPEKLRVGAFADEVHVPVVRRDAGDEPEHADGEEDDADDESGNLDGTYEMDLLCGRRRYSTRAEERFTPTWQ